MADTRVARFPEAGGEHVSSGKRLHFLWLLSGSWAVGDCQADPRLRTTPGSAASGVIAAALCAFGLLILASQSRS